MLAPVKAEPAHVLLNGLDILHRLLARVGVVETQMAGSAVFLCNTEVQADGLGMAYVQEAVRLRRKAGDDAGVLAGGKVFGNNLPDEIKGLVGGGDAICSHYSSWKLFS